MEAKKIVLIICGGIAAYKSLDLLRALKTAGHEIETVLTEAGRKFVTPLSIAALSGRPPHMNMFEAIEEAQMRHLALTRNADFVVIAPATADILAKLSHGIANDLASTLLLASAAPVLVAPAMNVKMWQHPATQRNIETLRGDGVAFVEPEDGLLACGESGVGRLASVERIIIALSQLLETNKALKGLKIVITSGPTHEAIDPVRFISNRSSGKQGQALAQAARDAGADVTYISGPVAMPPPHSVNYVPVISAKDMLAATISALPADVFISCAAVADWRVSQMSDEKHSKKNLDATIKLTENTDILNEVSHHKLRPRLVIGFCAETSGLKEKAEEKRRRKGCDWMLANDVSDGKVIGMNDNRLHFIKSDESQLWPLDTKFAQAKRLMSLIEKELKA